LFRLIEMQGKAVGDESFGDGVEAEFDREKLAALLRRAREAEWYAARCAEDERAQRQSAESALAALMAEKVGSPSTLATPSLFGLAPMSDLKAASSRFNSDARQCGLCAGVAALAASSGKRADAAAAPQQCFVCLVSRLVAPHVHAEDGYRSRLWFSRDSGGDTVLSHL